MSADTPFQRGSRDPGGSAPNLTFGICPDQLRTAFMSTAVGTVIATLSSLSAASLCIPSVGRPDSQLRLPLHFITRPRRASVA